MSEWLAGLVADWLVLEGVDGGADFMTTRTRLGKNISSRQLTDEERQLLSKGLNYNTEDANQSDFIADLEHALKTADFKEHTANNIRHQLASYLHYHKKPIDMTKTKRKTLNNLKNDNNIIILPADKGRTKVVMDRTDYANKANDLLQDKNTYKKTWQEPDKNNHSRINNKLKSLKDQQKLENKTYLKIRPSDATTARFYGLPKIHKPNMPLRPIVSLPGSPT